MQTSHAPEKLPHAKSLKLTKPINPEEVSCLYLNIKPFIILKYYNKDKILVLAAISGDFTTVKDMLRREGNTEAIDEVQFIFFLLS